MDEMAKALMDAPLFVAFMTNSYVSDEDCCNLFKYARLTLRKPILLVTLGSGFEWRQSKLGILLADEVRLGGGGWGGATGQVAPLVRAGMLLIRLGV